MGYDTNFMCSYRINYPVVVHKRDRMQGEFRLNIILPGFRRFEGGYI